MRSRADGGTARRIALCGMFAAAAFALSYAEHVLLPPLPLPLPGLRLGLGNIAILAAMYYTGKGGAAAVAGVKVVLSFLLFGSPVSAVFSTAGTALSLAVLVILDFLPDGTFSFIGASVASASAHSLGQIAAASLIAGSGAVFYYLAPMLVFSTAAGAVSGLLVNLLLGRAGKGRETP